MVLFCAAIRRDLVFLVRFPFFSYVHIFSYEMSLDSLLKCSYSRLSSHFCFLVTFVLFILVLSVLILVAVISFPSCFQCSLRVVVSMSTVHRWSFLLLLTLSRSARPVEISWTICISKSQRNLCDSFSWTDPGLCIYRLFAWANWNFVQLKMNNLYHPSHRRKGVVILFTDITFLLGVGIFCLGSNASEFRVGKSSISGDTFCTRPAWARARFDIAVSSPF